MRGPGGAVHGEEAGARVGPQLPPRLSHPGDGHPQAAALAMRTARVGLGLGSSAGLGGGGGYRMPAGRGTPGTCPGAWRLPCIPASHDPACLFGRPQVAAVLGRGAGHPGCPGPAAGDFGAASLRLGRPGPAAAPQPRPEHPGESSRLREKRQAGLFPPQQHLAASREEAGGNYPD